MQSIDMFLETTREFLHQIAAFLPRLALALAVVAVGWILAKVVRFAVEKALRAINFNVLTERAGTDHFLQQGGLQGDTTTLFGLFAYWVVILATLIIAFNGLGPYFARFVGEAVNTYCLDAQISDADILGKIARYLIMTFVVMIALSQVEVGGDIVQRTFLIILGGLVLALALAFGLGGKEWAAAMLERWWPQRRKDDQRTL